MFDFLKRTKEDARNNVPAETIVGPGNLPVDNVVNAIEPQPPPAGLIPYNEATLEEIFKRVSYVLKLNPERSYTFQKINFDNKKKCHWKYADRIGISSDSVVTEEEFWVAYIKQYINNIIKNEEDKKPIFQNSKTLDNTNTLIDQKINQLNGVSDFVSGMLEKINGMNARQQEFFKSISSQLDENPVLKMTENTFIFEGKKYITTPKQKSVLLELSKSSGWTTAKKLSEKTTENKGFIGMTLLRLKDKGYPIISYKSGGKRFWALEKGHKEKGKKGNITSENPENKSELLLHALRQYKEINGRPPTATEISDQLKWDIFYVKNELKSLHLSGKIQKEKMIIDWKTIKVWTVEEKK
ncbi:MAG: hypothetical protein OI715_00245 (plasmid) [Candidatus Methanoperedens sp.]|nr:MAG: hypothetical protein OI715_00245 [Candidatus Methanoperedens sp.]